MAERGQHETRLSPSSASMLRGCERKFYFKKVKNLEPDPDSDTDWEAFKVGKALHGSLEKRTYSTVESLDAQEIKDELTKNGLSYDYFPLIVAMMRKYFDIDTAHPIQPVVAEMMVSTNDFLGYIDLIATCEGKWWIMDLKTASSLSEFVPARLHQDRQLGFYSMFATTLGKSKELAGMEFGGIIYRVVTKSRAVKKESESEKTFSERIYKSIKGHQLIVNASDLDIPLIAREFLRLRKRHKELIGFKNPPDGNFGFCDNYHRPCEYWSKCYGATFTECSERKKVLTV